MQFALLAEFPDHVKTVSNWLFDEWGDPSQGHSPSRLSQRLHSRISMNSLPQHILALEDGEPVGFVVIKLFEMEEYPEREHWLGSLFVPLDKRGSGIGSALISEVIRRCDDHGISRLSLQTEELSGGIYRRHGWSDVEEITSRGDRVLVMERHLE